MSIGEMTLEDAAKEAAGNWQKLESFCWFRERDIDEPENWAIIYTHNRDCGLLDQSNAEAIAEAMEPLPRAKTQMSSLNPITIGRSDMSMAFPSGSFATVRSPKRSRATMAYRTDRRLSGPGRRGLHPTESMKRHWKTSVMPHGG